MSLKVYPMTNTGLFGLWGCESGFRGSDIFIIAKSASGSALTWRMSRQERTFSCLKNRIILSSLKTRLLLTRLWKTLGSFFSATRFPSRGSVTDHTTPNAPYLWSRFSARFGIDGKILMMAMLMSMPVAMMARLMFYPMGRSGWKSAVLLAGAANISVKTFVSQKMEFHQLSSDIMIISSSFTKSWFDPKINWG